jgi:hypothetical protein
MSEIHWAEITGEGRYVSADRRFNVVRLEDGWGVADCIWHLRAAEPFATLVEAFAQAETWRATKPVSYVAVETVRTMTGNVAAPIAAAATFDAAVNFIGTELARQAADNFLPRRPAVHHPSEFNFGRWVYGNRTYTITVVPAR